MRITILLLLCAGSVFAQATPKAQCEDLGGTWSKFKQRCDMTHKHILKDKKFWLGVGAIAITHALDGYSTSKVRNTCPGCAERNFVLGKHPTDSQLALFEISAVTWFSFLHGVSWYAGHDDPSPAWRAIGYTAVPAVDAAVILPAVVSNFQSAK